MDHPLIIVVGAGPVGLMLSLLLSCDRVPVCVLDKNDTLQPSNELITLGPDACALLDRCGCLDPVLSQSVCFSSLEVVLAEHKEQAVPWSLLGSEHPYACVVSCGVLKQVMHEALLEQGVHVMHNSTFTHLEPHHDLLTAHVLQQGEQRTITARMVVAADGRHSTVRQSLSQPFHTFNVPQHTHVLVQNNPLRNAKARMQLQAHHHGWSVRTQTAQQHHLEHMVLGHALPIAPEPPKDSTLSAPWHWLRTHEHPLCVLQSFQQGSVFFAGDAGRCDGVLFSRSLNLGFQDAATFASLFSQNQVHRYGAEREAASWMAFQQWRTWSCMLPNTLWRQWIHTALLQQTVGQKALLRFWSGTPQHTWSLPWGRKRLKQPHRQP